MNQSALRLYHTVTEAQVYHAWLNNAPVKAASHWDHIVRDPLMFGGLAREAAYTHRGQRPRRFSPLPPLPPLTEHTMNKKIFVLDLAEARQIRLALSLCRERIACPATTAVARQEAMRELRAVQEVFLAHEERAAQLHALNRELQSVPNT